MNNNITKSLITICTLLTFLLLISCTDQVVPNKDKEEIHSTKTKGGIAEDYYYYHGKPISLKVNEEYVNILLDTSYVKNDVLSAFCKDYNIEAKTKLDKDGLFKAHLNQRTDYAQGIEKLRADSRVKKVLPYFERGNGADPIGTSHYFYVQLKEIFPSGYEEENAVSYSMKKFDLEALHEVSERLGVRIVKEIPYMPDWYILSIEGSGFQTAVDAANCFYETGQFEEIDPAFMFNFKPNTINDPLFIDQWGLKNTIYPGYDINVEGAWSISTGSGVKIAIVDQGVDPNHIDLVANISNLSYDALTQSAPSVYLSAFDHGTKVAGVAAAKGNNNTQIAGVSYNSQIMSVSHHFLVSTTTSAELASGISWAWQNGADVINNSWGDQGGNLLELHTTTLEAAIVNAMTVGRSGKGSVVLFAAGNYGNNGAVMDYPATFDDRIMTVGAIRKTGLRRYSSGYGPALDVVAPGEEILTTFPESETDYSSGTSIATPHVSGVAALMLSANPNLKREEVVRFIELTANKISPNNTYSYNSYQNRNNGYWNSQMGYGLVDATKAVMVANSAGNTPPSGSPSLDFSVISGVSIVYSDNIVMGSNTNASVCFSLQPAQVNSAYTYCWHFSTTGDAYWYPSFTYVGNDSGVYVNIPKPNTSSVLKMRCEIYSGSTFICTAYFNLGVQ